MVACVLDNNSKFDLIYKHLLHSLKDNANEPFDYEAYISDLYNKLAKDVNEDTAAAYVMHIPKILVSLENTGKYDKNITSDDISKISDLRRSFNDAEKGIDFIKNRYKISEATQIKSEFKNNDVVTNAPVLIDVSKKSPASGIKATEAFSGTLQTNKRGDKSLQSKEILEEPDPDFDNYRALLNRINSLEEGALVDVNSVSIDGFQLHFKAQNFLMFGKKTDNENLLAKADKKDLITSRTYLSGKITPDKNVTQANERVILILTDENGNRLYADKDGKLSTEKTPNNKLVYQFLRIVKKDDNKYNIVNMYGIGEQIARPKNSEEYAIQQAEFEQLYKFQNQFTQPTTINTTKTLPIVFFTRGQLSDKSFLMKDLIDKNDAEITKVQTFDDRKNIYVELKLNDLNLKGTLQSEQLKNLPFLLNMLVDAVANKNISLKDKYELLKQHITPTNKFFGLVNNIFYDETHNIIYINRNNNKDGSKNETIKINNFSSINVEVLKLALENNYVNINKKAIELDKYYTYSNNAITETSGYLDFLINNVDVNFYTQPDELANYSFIFNPSGETKPFTPSTKVVTEEFLEPVIEEPLTEEQNPDIKDSNISDLDSDSDIVSDDNVFDRKGYSIEDINPEKVNEAKAWWNSKQMEPLRKLISFERMDNLVNSNVFARFIVSASVLADGKMGKIQVNEKLGSAYDNLTIYHEAWHVFSQLFLTKQEKINLYNELKNFKDSKGNKPYADKSFIELEEMLAEDFRNYVKSGNVKKETPKRNSLFRRILNFLKALFSGNLKAVNSTDTTLDSLNSPMAKDLFNKLYRGQFNDYTPNIDNRLYYAFDRGIEEVADKRNDILTPKESNDIAESIDNFIAEELNDEVTNPEDKFKAMVLLSRPDYRDSLYVNARIKFNELLQKEKAEFEKRSNKPKLDFNSLKTIEELEENAIAVMRNKKGEHKYFFLTSQIENFKNLQPSYKRGDRVRGEEYKDTIEIVGDFFRHRNILVKEGRAADVVLVSNLEDAIKQYQNYIKGGSEVFTSLDTDPNNLSEQLEPLSLEDEQRLNKIRRLQAVVDNWGDAKSGVVKYHRSRTAFKLLKSDMVDVNSDDIYDSLNDEDEQIKTDTTDGTLDRDKQGQTPLDKMLSKEVLSVLNSLFAVDPNGKYSYDEYGFKKRAEFSYVFNIIAKTIGGIRDRQEAYNKLVEVGKKFPEIKQLVETKLSSPDAIVNQFDLQLSTAFWQGFSKPRVRYMQLYAFVDKQTGALDYRVKESSLTVNNIINKWAETFSSAIQSKTNYIITDIDNNNTFNNQKFRTNYNTRDTSDTLNLDKIDSSEQKLTFLKNLGIQLDNNDNVKQALSEINDASYGFAYKAVVKSTENPIETLKKEQSVFLKKLAEIQNKFGFDTASTGVLRANGNISYQELNWSSLHAKVDALNNVKTIGELWPDTKNGDDGPYGHMSYLNPEINPHTPFIRTFQSLFETGDNISNQRVRNSIPIEVVPIDGFSAEMSDGSNMGNTLTELDPLSKFHVEFNYMLIGGLQEFPRHSEKKFSMGVKYNTEKIGPLNQPSEYQDKNLFVSIKRFTKANPNSIDGGGNYAVKNFFLGYLNGEYNRILKFEHSKQKDELAKITGYNKKIQTAVGEKIAGKAFIIFDDMLSIDTLKKLYKAAEENKSFDEVLETLEQQITTDIRKYFYNKSKNLYDNYLSKLDYIPPIVLNKAGYSETEPLTQEQKILLLGAYLFNSYIHHVETNLLLHGDPAQWEHGKEEFHKRIPGLTSDGEGFLVDQNMIDYVNTKFLGKKSYGKILGAKYDNLKLGYTVNTAVIKDAERESIYLKDMMQAWKEEYQSRNLKPSEIEELLAEDKEAYEKMKEGDGFAYMTFDAYRMLKKAQNTWSFEQELLYTKIINGEKVERSDVTNFFPVYKLHYYGAIKNDYYPVTGMHKFAVIPLIPGVNAKEGTELDKLHKQMLKENIVYTTFASGSKGANLTSDGKVDDAFAKDSNDKLFKDNITFTKNPIYLANLKEVTKINDYYKESLPIATQTRGIIIDNLFKDGELINQDNESVVNNYLNSVKEYTNVLKEALLNNVGIEFVDGRTVGNLSEFINLVRSELKSREIPEHLIKLINTDLKGNLAFDFSLHPENDGIEKLLMSYIQKGLIKQKTTGEPLVQTPSTFTQGLWDAGLTPITESEIKEQLGTNTLPFYITKIVDGKRQRTTEMKVAIALQGPFLNLLKAKDLDGNVIGTIDRLNELIKNPEWFAKNKKSLTIFGPRIPNDASNTIEAATVYHFLDTSFGNSIILPTEIVAKAGSDFDADKLFMVFPNIDNNGEYINKGVDNFKSSLDKVKNLKKEEIQKQGLQTAKELIDQQMMFLQNKFQSAAVEILMLPENYAYLTRPNGMYLVTKYVNDLKDKNAYNRFENVNSTERSNISPTRIFDVDYNLYKFDANLSLELSLGILAKLSKSHPIFKSVGAKMPATYRLAGTAIGAYKGTEAPVFMPFKTNTVKNKNGEEVISLAGETTELGTRISDLISHNLQGVLDRAKESFPFDLKLIPEAMDVLSYMMQAGVNEQTMFLFVNHPIIAKYFNQQKIYNSSVSKAISLFNAKKQDKDSKKSPKAKALSDVLNGVLDGITNAELENILNQASTLKLKAIINSLQDVPDTELEITRKGQPYPEIVKAKDLSKYTSSIETIKDKKSKIEVYTPIDKKGLTLKKNYIFVTQALNNKYLKNNEVSQAILKTGLDNSDTTSIQALTIFMNFYTMEEQYSGIKNLQLNFSPDTQKITTIQQLKARVETLKELKGNTLIDQDFYNRLLKESVISSFVQDEIIAGLMETVFKFKLNSQIINYIDDALNRDYTKQAQIRAKFRGFGVDQKENFIKQFNNGVINYMLQNYLSKQLLKTSESKNELYSLFNSFNNLPIIEVTNGDVITIDLTDNTVKINKTAMVQEYNSLSAADKILFPEFSIYQNYKLNEVQAKLDYPISTAQELSVYKLYNETLSNEESYQKLIREIALMKSYNPSYVLGTKPDASFTSTVMNIIQILSEETKFEFSILKQLAPKTVKSKNGVTNKVIVLNNKKEVEGQLANNYNNQLKRLGDVTVNKTNPFDNILVSDVFNHFSMMMYYQHGVGKTATGFVKALDSSKYKDQVTRFKEDFIKRFLKSDVILGEIFKNLMGYSKYKNYTISDTESDPNLVETEDGVLEEFDWDDYAASAPTPVEEPIQPVQPQVLVSTNNPAEYTNYSGGAIGGDTIWAEVGKEYGLGKQVDYTPATLKKLTSEQLQEVESAYQKAVKDLGRKPLAADTYSGGLVRRDYLQAKAADAVYAVGTLVDPGQKDLKGYVNKTNKKIVSGGTGYAVQMAINLDKTVFVFNQADNTWWMYDNTRGEFGVYGATPILTKNFAGIGTREINEAGKQAIRDVYANTFKPQAPVSTGFQGYKGGFEDKGKGTAEGDGKDKAMRAVATSSIVEIKSDKRPSSSMTTLENVGTDNDYSYEKDRYIGSSYNGSLPAFSGIGIMNNFGTTVMLARNGELKNLPLSDETKRLINIANQQGVSFVVGDMPGVDSQFIDYLQEIGAKFTIYHTGSTPRIQITQPTVASIKLIPENEYTITSHTNEPKKGTYHDILRTGKKPLQYKIIDVSDKGVLVRNEETQKEKLFTKDEYFKTFNISEDAGFSVLGEFGLAEVYKYTELQNGQPVYSLEINLYDESNEGKGLGKDIYKAAIQEIIKRNGVLTPGNVVEGNKIWESFKRDNLLREEITREGDKIIVIGNLATQPTTAPVTTTIEISSDRFSRQSVTEDANTMYLFTDNAQRTSAPNATTENVDKNTWYYKKYKSQTDKPIHFGSLNNPTSAIIRGLNNAYPISTMSAYGTNWTDANFDLFKKTIDDEINQIKQDLSKFSKLKIGNYRIGQGGLKAKLPEQHQNYLDTKLKEIGIDNTGETPKLITPTQPTAASVTKKQLSTQPVTNVLKTKAQISSSEKPIKIYSDGSDIKGTGKVGFGAVYEHEGKEYALSGTEEGFEVKDLQNKFPNAKFSNPTMEMLALVKVLESFENTSENLDIYQDYKGAVNYGKLWNYSEGSQQREPKPWNAKEEYIKYLVERAVKAIEKIKSNGGSVKINWVKGHAGNKMNDRADFFAKNRDNFNNLTQLLNENITKDKSVQQQTSLTQPTVNINKNFEQLFSVEEQNAILNSLRKDPAFKGAYTNLSDIELINRINLKLGNTEKRNAVLELLNKCLK